MKKALSLILTIAVVLGFAGCSAVPGESESEPEPQDPIVGSWDIVSEFSYSKETRYEDFSNTFVVENDGTALLSLAEGTTSCEWVANGQDSESGVYSYTITYSDVTLTAHYNSTDALLVYETTGDDIHGMVFVKSGSGIVITDETDYSQLLGFDLESFGITYTTDAEALQYIQGDWTGLMLFMDGEQTEVWPGSLTLNVTDNIYSIYVAGDSRQGELTFRNSYNNMPMYDMHGDYEGVYLAYEESTGMLMLYEDESGTAMLFMK